jgi:bifunctional non-homologous end joining protein LigD
VVAPRARAPTPYPGPHPAKLARFVEPRLVASVEYSDMTQAGTLRHPVYKGLRDDVEPAEVGPPQA